MKTILGRVHEKQLTMGVRLRVFICGKRLFEFITFSMV